MEVATPGGREHKRVLQLLKTRDAAKIAQYLVEEPLTEGRLVKAIRETLTLDEIVTIVEIVCDWIEIHIFLPNVVVTQELPTLPSLDRLINFSSCLIDASFPHIQSKPELLGRLEQVVSMVLDEDINSQKIVGQIFALSSADSSSFSCQGTAPLIQPLNLRL